MCGTCVSSGNFLSLQIHIHTSSCQIEKGTLDKAIPYKPLMKMPLAWLGPYATFHEFWLKTDQMNGIGSTIPALPPPWTPFSTWKWWFQAFACVSTTLDFNKSKGPWSPIPSCNETNTSFHPLNKKEVHCQVVFVGVGFKLLFGFASNSFLDLNSKSYLDLNSNTSPIKRTESPRYRLWDQNYSIENLSCFLLS